MSSRRSPPARVGRGSGRAGAMLVASHQMGLAGAVGALRSALGVRSRPVGARAASSRPHDLAPAARRVGRAGLAPVRWPRARSRRPATHPVARRTEHRRWSRRVPRTALRGRRPCAAGRAGVPRVRIAAAVAASPSCAILRRRRPQPCGHPARRGCLRWSSPLDAGDRSSRGRRSTGARVDRRASCPLGYAGCTRRRGSRRTSADAAAALHAPSRAGHPAASARRASLAHRRRPLRVRRVRLPIAPSTSAPGCAVARGRPRPSHEPSRTSIRRAMPPPILRSHGRTRLLVSAQVGPAALRLRPHRGAGRPRSHSLGGRQRRGAALLGRRARLRQRGVARRRPWHRTSLARCPRASAAWPPLVRPSRAARAPARQTRWRPLAARCPAADAHLLARSSGRRPAADAARDRRHRRCGHGWRSVRVRTRHAGGPMIPTSRRSRSGVRRLASGGSWLMLRHRSPDRSEGPVPVGGHLGRCGAPRQVDRGWRVRFRGRTRRHRLRGSRITRGTLEAAD